MLQIIEKANFQIKLFFLKFNVLFLKTLNYLIFILKTLLLGFRNFYIIIYFFFYFYLKERMAERLKAIDCKSIRLMSYVGSNPTSFMVEFFKRRLSRI